MFRVLSLALLAVLALPGAARAQGFTLFAAGSQSVITDGERYAVYVATDGTLAVIDDANRFRRFLPIPPKCYLYDAVAGSGTLALPCQDGELLVNLRSGRIRPFDVSAPLARIGLTGDKFDIQDIGRRWIRVFAGESNSYRLHDVLIDRRTGRTRSARLSQRYATDLDAARGRQRMCGALRTPVGHGLNGVRLPEFSYDRALGLVTFRPHDMALTSCAGRTRILSTSYVEQPQVGGGAISWYEGDQGRVLVRSRAGDLEIPYSAPGQPIPVLAHTRRRLYLTDAAHNIWVAQMPKAR